jgi:hypothetical protein
LAESSLRGQYPLGDFAAPDHELAARLQASHELPVGTLGYEYVEFYRRNGLRLPGDDPHIPLTFVSHDMCHVIGGYEPVGIDEIALGGMQLAMADTDVHWLQLLTSACTRPASSEPRTSRPGSARWVDRAPPRPSPTRWLEAPNAPATSPTSDHMAMADRPLADVRAQFGVPPRQR